MACTSNSRFETVLPMLNKKTLALSTGALYPAKPTPYPMVASLKSGYMTFSGNGTAYKAEEIEVIKKATGKK
jgi:hypothetical protein